MFTSSCIYFYSLLGQIGPLCVLILIAIIYRGNITAHLCGCAHAVRYTNFTSYKLAVRTNLCQRAMVCTILCYTSAK
jgi:hypothetical protein